MNNKESITQMLLLSDTHGNALPNITKTNVLVLNGDYTSKRYDKYCSQYWQIDRLLRSIELQVEEYYEINNELLFDELFLNVGNHETIVAREIIHSGNVGHRASLRHRIILFKNKLVSYGIKFHTSINLTSGFAEQKIIESKFIGKVFMTPFSEKINIPEVWGNNWDDNLRNAAIDIVENNLDIDVIISHAPPYGIADGINNGSGNYSNRFGDRVLLDIINKLDNLKIFVAGHIHSAYGVYEYNRTTIYSVAHVDENYEPKNNFMKIEI